jgi:two-component system sensor histidine kinase DegS
LANTAVKRINDIIRSTLNVIEESQGAIFDIAESARKEVADLKLEMERCKIEAKEIITECEELEIKVAKSRSKLAMINSNFNLYTEEDMKKAYQETNDLLVSLAVARERERQVILHRNDVERRLKNAHETVVKAEKLVAQVGTVLSYLKGDLQRIDEHIESSENKRLLAVRIIKAQEDERRRIAREMHDGPAQSMSNVVLKAEICEKIAEIDIKEAIAELKGLKDVVRSCLTEVRRIIYDLMPMSIEDLGLRPTLQKYIDNFSKQYRIRVDFNVRGDYNRIKDKNIALAAFRVVQESLNNIRKHADATFVNIQMECSQKSFILRIKDDGKGFDATKVTYSQDENSGFGVVGMKERVELLDGTFSIMSAVGTGTTVKVKLPYEMGSI